MYFSGLIACYRGGVALAISHEFLAQFSSASWIKGETGRVEKLELRGSMGSLDLFCVYLDDQSATARRECFNLIPASIAPRSAVLSLIFGDFSFIEHSHDRLCKTTGHHTGIRDKVDAELL